MKTYPEGETVAERRDKLAASLWEMRKIEHIGKVGSRMVTMIIHQDQNYIHDRAMALLDGKKRVIARNLEIEKSLSARKDIEIQFLQTFLSIGVQPITNLDGHGQIKDSEPS